MKKIILLLLANILVFSGIANADSMVIRDGTGSTKYVDVEGAGNSSAPYNTVNIDKYNTIYRAERLIEEVYGDTVSVFDKNKELRKWGSNQNVGTTKAVIMTLPSGIVEESMLTSNGIISVISDDAGDTMDIDFYEGHTYSSGNLTFYNSDVAGDTDPTLTGTTAVTLPTAVARATRARLDSPANGNIYFYEGGATTSGVPDDADQVHLIIPAGEIQSQKNATSISSVDYWIIDSATISVLEKTAAWAQARIEIKPASAADTAWFPITQWIGVTDSSGTVSFLHQGEFLVVPKNYDARMVAVADGANTYLAGGMSGPLALVVQ